MVQATKRDRRIGGTCSRDIRQLLVCIASNLVLETIIDLVPSSFLSGATGRTVTNLYKYKWIAGRRSICNKNAKLPNMNKLQNS